MHSRKILVVVVGILVIAGGIYYYRDSLFPQGSFKLPFVSSSTLAQIRKEILTSDPLRSLENAPNAHLTQEGVIEETNNQRALENRPALKENTKLDEAAQLKLQDMFTKQYFEHVSPSGVGPSNLAEQVGYGYILIGENLALGNFADDKALVTAWMNSPGHRANILHPEFQEIGVAVGQGTFEGKKVWLAVQEFGKPESACPSIDDALKAKIDTERDDLDKREQDLAARRAELDQSQPHTEQERQEYNQKAAEYNQLLKEYSNKNVELQNDITTYNNEVRAYNECIGQ